MAGELTGTPLYALAPFVVSDDLAEGYWIGDQLRRVGQVARKGLYFAATLLLLPGADPGGPPPPYFWQSQFYFF